MSGRKGRAAPRGTILLLAVLSGLVACSGDDHLADIRQYIQAVGDSPRGQVTSLPEFAAYQAFTYGGSELRSPFERWSAGPADSTRRQHAGPPTNHVKQYLETQPLATLVMVGTLARDKMTFALIEDASGRIHRVQSGDYLGAHWGRIGAIESTRIHLTEIVASAAGDDAAGSWVARPVSIELKNTQAPAGTMANAR